MRRGSQLLCLVVGSSLTALGAGCALVPLTGLNWQISDSIYESDDSSARSARRVAPQDAIGIEVSFIEVPRGDLLAGKALWDDLDQIAAVPPDQRNQLLRNGFQFGIAPANLPYALRSLIEKQSGAVPGQRTLRNVYQMPSGLAHRFPCNTLGDQATVQFVTDNGVKPRQYENARCVIRCQVEKSQHGWVRLEILPEIHHGQLRMRPVATNSEWDWDGSQQIDPLYAHQFAVELNEGESLVLGSVDDEAESPGACFFRGKAGDQVVETLLVIRVKSIDQVTPVRQSGW